MLERAKCNIAFTFDVSEGASSEARYMFLKRSCAVSEQEVVRKLFLWQDKYPGFGFIQTDVGTLFDTWWAPLDGSEEAYHRLIFEGVVAIRGEIIGSNVQ